MMQRRACAQATKALIQLGKKISLETLFLVKPPMALQVRLRVLKVICFVLKLATSH